MHIDYSVVVGCVETLAQNKNLGNEASVLAFTVALDRTGKLAHAHAGALT